MELLVEAVGMSELPEVECSKGVTHREFCCSFHS